MSALCGPGVCGVQGGALAEDGLALVRKVGHVGELMAVELEDGAEGLLLVPLAAQAACDIIDVLEEHIDL